MDSYVKNKYIHENFNPTFIAVHYCGTDAIAGYESRAAPPVGQLVLLVMEKLTMAKMAPFFSYMTIKVL